jgi:hypothetical protein
MDAPSLEHALKRIPGVEAARVVMNGSAPSEVHVITLPTKPPKQVVRDVQSVALASLGIQLDRRIVSVVQVDEGDLSAGDRPMVDDIAEEISGSHMTMTVTLTWHDERLIGKAQGPAAAATRLQLVAEATLSALEMALSDDAAFAVIAVDTPQIGGHSVAIAAVVIVADGSERLVSGSAIIGTDPSKAMVKAVLDALNRQVPNLRRA